MRRKIIPFPGHHWAHCDKDCTGCFLCDGGLSVCTVCGLGEGALTTDCPQARCAEDLGAAIYAGKLDFRGGRWHREPSPHSPAYYRGPR